MAVLFWLLTMIVLINRHYPLLPGAGPELQRPEAHIFEQQWAGIYRNGEKIGYAMSRLDRDREGYRAYEESIMKLRTMGVERDIKLTTEARLNGDFRLESFIFRMESDIDMTITGSVQGGELLISMEAGGIVSDRKIPLREAPHLGLSLRPALRGRKLEVGGNIRLPMFDPSSLAQGFMELNVTGKDRITVMGRKLETFMVTGMFKGMEIFMWVAEDGEILRQESMGMVFVRESGEEAVRLQRPSIDLVADMSVPFNLGLPPKTAYLKVRLAGIDLEGLELDGGTQSLTGDILEIKAAVAAQAAVAATEGGVQPEASLTRYLGDTMFVESKDPGIVAMAETITAGEGDPFERARLIHEWVYGNIKKAPTISIPRSTAVLKSRRGDCNEHTTLFTALARASRIPTRIAIGLVYQEGRFFYHAWPEVHLGGWFPVDPTLGQFPADAARIRLLTGGLERQIRLAAVMGKLKIEGLDYR
jgi:hypothetical protein